MKKESAIIPLYFVVKKFFLFSYFFFALTVCTAQQFGPQQLMADNLDAPRYVAAVDLDSDGIPEIVTTSQFDDVVAWYKNQGDGTFGARQLIDVLNQLMFLDVADLNNDGNLDIVVSVVFSDQLLWYENLGNETFGPKQVISDVYERCINPITADFDGDGDLDVATTFGFDSTIRWFENSDGEGTFTTAHTVSNQGNNGRNIAVGDLDGDGDPDIVAESPGSESLSWYKNLNGEGDFSPPIILDPNYFATISIAVADFDGDSDLDIVSIKGNGEHYYFENLDGQGSYSSPSLIPDSPDAAYSVFAADLDNDGDMDILSSGGSNDPNVSWFENDGSANFGNRKIITTQISEQSGAIVKAADLDNDGDKDVFYNEGAVDTIFWHENFTILSTKDFTADNFTVYPNPTEECLYIETALPIGTMQVTIASVQGRQVFSGNIKPSNCLNIAKLPSGLYWAKIKTAQGNVQKKFIKK